MQKKLHLLIAMMVLMVSSAMAQITTSALAGKVTLEATGEEVIGATIQAVHEPSGTKYAAVSNVNGYYTIEGMRSGGPYTVTVTYIGYQTKVFKDVTLSLGETYDLPVWLNEDSQSLGEVVVSAKASKFAGEKTGASTNITSTAIANMPTVSRSISDLTRLSPYAGTSNSFAGGDGRSTNFTIDGANFNNNFGLSSSLPGGGNPISIDAIDEIQVAIAPFDVRQTNFIGGGINATTKSGTNTFKGTAYTYYTDQAMRGNRIDGEDLGTRADESLRTYGFTLGGPILKDKLFFFVNFERETIPGTVIGYHAKGSNGSGIESACTLEDMNTVSNILKNTYGYDPGSATDFPGDESNNKLLARIDWNINTNHHLAVRYNFTKNTSWNEPSGNACNVNGRDRTTNRVGETSMAFANSMYSMDNKVQSLSFDLNSRFGNNISNQLLATYSDIQDVRGSNSDIFPFIDIMNGGHHYMSAGYELFSYNNGVKNKIFNIKDDFRYTIGAHNILAGVNFEHQFANNSYMRNATGYYRFQSLQDFINCNPSDFALTYGWNGEENPTAQVTFNQIGWYVQDEWKVNKNLKLTGGIRFDDMLFDNSDLATNKAIYALDFNGQHVDTGKWPNSSIQVSPRIGFSWDVFGDRSLKVRGGTGLFQGRLPLVYFTNMPTNAAMVQNTAWYISDAASLAALTKGGKFLTNTADMIAALNLPTQISDDNQTVGSTISGVASDFKMPQVWKTSIGVDYVVPVSFPFTLTAEAMYTKNIQAVYIDNINFKDASYMGTFSGADNRPMYSNYQVSSETSVPAVILSNTSKGYGYTLNLTANMEPVKDLNLMAAITKTESKEISGLPGSDPYSTWTGTYVVDGPNDLKAQRSQYVIPTKLIASASYYIPFNHNKLLRGTTLSLFYQGYSYSGNSCVYSNDMNGDGIVNDLMYIPANDSEIQFKDDADGSQRAAFWAFVDQDKYLSSHKGEYAEAYADRAPWLNRFDFRLTEDFSFRCGRTNHKFQLSLDIKNIGNMFNSKWGVPQYTGNTTYTIAPLKYEGVNANNVPTFSMNKVNGSYMSESFQTYKAYSNCWKIQIGFKYFLN